MANEITKPSVRLTGTDGNIFSLLGLASRTLKQAGLASQVEGLEAEVFAAESYHEALVIIQRYVQAS